MLGQACCSKAACSEHTFMVISEPHSGTSTCVCVKNIYTTSCSSRSKLRECHLSKGGTCNGNLLNRRKQLLRRFAQVFLNDLGYVLVRRYRALVQHIVPHGVHILGWQYVVLCSMHLLSGTRVNSVCTVVIAADLPKSDCGMLAWLFCTGHSACAAYQLCHMLPKLDIDAAICKAQPLQLEGGA